MDVLVAPLVGAWIEITLSRRESNFVIASLLSWERGLKFVRTANHLGETRVAPLVGAWIEI